MYFHFENWPLRPAVLGENGLDGQNFILVKKNCWGTKSSTKNKTNCKGFLRFDLSLSAFEYRFDREQIKDSFATLYSIQWKLLK